MFILYKLAFKIFVHFNWSTKITATGITCIAGLMHYI